MTTTTLPLTVPGPGEVHLWRADLDASEADPACLDEAEAARAGRLRAPELARRFVASRTQLKRTLARYVGGAPHELRLSLSDLGRPHLADAGFDFNLSHSGADFVLAVARARVGVDVERALPDSELADMARQVMSGAELARFEALAKGKRTSAFYALWTAKEAVIKAVGSGPSRDPRSFDIGWDAPLAYREAGTAYAIARFEAGPGLAAAVALAAPIAALSILS